MATPVSGETAWWGPSLDDDGHDTTRLTALVGNHHATLSNFADIAAGRVEDTDDGGIRAIDFDDSDAPGRVEHDGADVADDSTRFQVSTWYKTSDAGTGAKRLSLIGQ